MTIEEARKYFQSFTCEVLTSSADNQTGIQDFSSKIRNNNLEKYLKVQAWEHDSQGITRVYLIKDTGGNIVLFFSLKCGVVFTTDKLDDDYQQLNEAEKDYIKLLIDYRIKGDMDSFYKNIELGKKVYQNQDLLQQIAEYRYSSKNESKMIGDNKNVMKVESCCSAIEIQHFCRCDDYQPSIITGFPLGFGLFWEVIVSKVEEIIAQVGCEYLYLFAADRSENSDDKKLISYYKEALLFNDLEDEGVRVLKPGYDNNCVGLVQPVNNLKNLREYAWEAFSDHLITD